MCPSRTHAALCAGLWGDVGHWDQTWSVCVQPSCQEGDECSSCKNSNCTGKNCVFVDLMQTFLSYFPSRVMNLIISLCFFSLWTSTRCFFCCRVTVLTPLSSPHLLSFPALSFTWQLGKINQYVITCRKHVFFSCLLPPWVVYLKWDILLHASSLFFLGKLQEQERKADIVASLTLLHEGVKTLRITTPAGCRTLLLQRLDKNIENYLLILTHLQLSVRSRQ